MMWRGYRPSSRQECQPPGVMDLHRPRCVVLSAAIGVWEEERVKDKTEYKVSTIPGDASVC